MSQAALGEAQGQGEAFALALTWLGPCEQNEISRLFAQHHLDLRKEMLTATMVRADELKAEYSQRYDHLRRRITGLAGAALGLYTLILAFVCLL
ncbi:hypothetical protein [Streptomyces sp. NPDC058674]|uniref:hypothetical protein n=1 Tax=Streptomyces sp. NPDC058674 TaxID=3346592 RepID=UPI0036496C48